MKNVFTFNTNSTLTLSKSYNSTRHFFGSDKYLKHRKLVSQTVAQAFYLWESFSTWLASSTHGSIFNYYVYFCHPLASKRVYLHCSISFRGFIDNWLENYYLTGSPKYSLLSLNNVLTHFASPCSWPETFSRSSSPCQHSPYCPALTGGPLFFPY